MTRVIFLAAMTMIGNMTDDFERMRAESRSERTAYLNRLIDRLDGMLADEHYAEAQQRFVSMFEMADPSDVKATDEAVAAHADIPTLMLSEWPARHRAFVERWLSKNADALEAVRRAASARRYAPKLSGGKPLIDDCFPPLVLHDLAKLAAIRANQAALDGDWAAAYAWNRCIHVMADHLCQQPFLIHKMTGMRFDRIGCEQLLVFFHRKPPPGVEALLAAVRAGDDLRCPSAVIDDAEDYIMLEYLEDWYAWLDDPAGHPRITELAEMYVGNDADTMDDLRDLFPEARSVPYKSEAQLRAAMKQSSVEQEWRVSEKLGAITSEWNKTPFPAAWRDVDSYHERWFAAAASPVISATMVLPPSQGRLLRAMTESYRAAVETVGLLLQYRARHGAWPDALDALVPRFAEKLPLDPFFSGEPLIFRRTDDASDFILYSVASNQKDDGGRHDESWKGGADYVFWPPVRTDASDAAPSR